VHIEQYQPFHLPQLTTLVNQHLSTAIPGVWLTSTHLMQRLYRHPEQYVTDPWVSERHTLCCIDNGRVIGAAHVLRYRDDHEVGDSLRGMAEIAWMVFYPDHAQAAHALYDAIALVCKTWGKTVMFACENGFAITTLHGIPTTWEHLITFFETHTALRSDTVEYVYCGDIADMPPRPANPLLRITRAFRDDRGLTFIGVMDGEEIGVCQVDVELTSGGALPHMSRFAEITNMQVEAANRGMGYGAVLLGHAAAYARQCGASRLILTTDHDDHARGSGAFYRACGLELTATLRIGWSAG
jgi:GNAT superfamily N-acetyltransferase